MKKTNEQSHELMEKYGQRSHDEMLGGELFPKRFWEKNCKAQVNTIYPYYDKEIELNADYRTRWSVDPVDVWKAVADIQYPSKESLLYVMHAKEQVQIAEEDNYQRRV